MLSFEDTKLIAAPKDRSRSRRSEIGEAMPEAVVELLWGVLATPAFLSKQELERRIERSHLERIALDRIVTVVCESPDTAGGRELARLLWAPFNQHDSVNLWRLKDVLDPLRQERVTEVFTACMQRQVPEDFLPRALTDSGEIERLDAAEVPRANGSTY